MLDRAHLESILHQAGAIAMDCWPGAGKTLECWEKAAGSPVCTGDLAVDAFLRRELGALLPAAGWLSEETTDNPDQRSGNLIWLVDPIDGTRDFIRGRRGWAVCVALIANGRPLLSMMAAPARNEFWQAEVGRGATRNGIPLRASRRTLLPGARMPARALSAEDADLCLVDQPNSIALRMAMVAADEADVLATLRWGYEWDIGAAALIAREAGAVVTDAFGEKLDYNKPDPRNFGVVVAAPAIHGAMLDRIADRARRLA